ncbi:hypothetical protein [Myxococcus sp. CA039A]|uniref:hypothetical protein n=1 Tax=Myxococcus sp. CA039A TaxID=2741737 RepID=UPI00157AEC53|nr:hypothetical protein [Myxococcus sp. CA039A]NTX57414.1 hypothetical protein [Myxococcus sp. CA039A]
MNQSDGSWEETPRCRQCNGELKLVKAEGPVETYRCVSCGFEVVGVVTPRLDEFIKSLGPRGKLRVRWGGKVAGAKETHALRQLAPDLQAKSVPEALALLRVKNEWVFEEITRSQAKDLEQKATALGLESSMEFPDAQ